MDRKLIGEILVDMGVVTADQVQEALEIKRRKGGATGAVLVELGYCTDRDVSTALAIQSGMKQVNLDETEIPPEVTDMMDPLTARTYRVVPVAFENDRMTVAMGDPENFRTLDDLHFLLGYEMEGAVADPGAVQRALDKYYREGGASMEEVMGQLENLDAEFFSSSDDANQSLDLADVRAMTESQPVKKLLNLVLLQAIRDKASDIHFEPFEDEFKMRYRIDGILYEMVPPPRHIALAVTSRIKVMANLDIAERRVPQDGRIELNVAGNPIDLRISVLPTMFGESVVMRVLDRTQVSLDLNKVGMRDLDLAEFRNIISLPHGIVVVTGPTGCGKTTTLYSALREINRIETKIITTEDPVEYDIEGLIQVPINADIGLTFASCLRSILRQDPDVILVGEMRDLETAEIAIHASLTGHLVFSTLHTNDAPTSVTRMLDMGIEPYLLTSTVEAIVAQRLIRRICLNCRSEFKPTEEMLMELSLTPESVRGRTFYYGRGCEQCNNTGYRGRTAIFEIMRLDDELRELIRSHASSNVLRAEARRRGMRSLRESGLLNIYDGITTIEEVVRETIVEE
ncbi:MAG: pilus assembly protein PilB [Anaerolineaceae bacterium]|nr:pilus assembly protein PilB [Anaerolineaceae bacterium]